VEQPVNVRVDTVAVSAADLQAQFDMALALHEMRVEMHDALRGLDALKLQVEERKKLALSARKDLPAEWTKALDAKAQSLDAFIATLGRPSGKPFWSEGPRLTERLAELAGALGNGNRRPTAFEAAYLEELRGEMQKARADLARYLAEAPPEIDKLLEAQGLPPLLATGKVPR
jgi:hypothetical protein